MRVSASSGLGVSPGGRSAWLTSAYTEITFATGIIAAAARHPRLTIPVTVKIRLQPAPGDTVRFARLLASAGASLVTVHGRQRGREDRRRDGSADLQAVAEVVAALAPLALRHLGGSSSAGDGPRLDQAAGQDTPLRASDSLDTTRRPDLTDAVVLTHRATGVHRAMAAIYRHTSHIHYPWLMFFYLL